MCCIWKLTCLHKICVNYIYKDIVGMDHTSLCCHFVSFISFSKINGPFPMHKPVFDKTVNRNDVPVHELIFSRTVVLNGSVWINRCSKWKLLKLQPLQNTHTCMQILLKWSRYTESPASVINFIKLISSLTV